MKNLIGSLLVLLYSIGSVLCYEEQRTLFIKMNERYYVGQPLFSAEDKVVALSISCSSWIGYLTVKAFSYTNGYSNAQISAKPESSINPDCDYKLPNQYFLVRNTIDGMYAIKFMLYDTFEYYLVEHKSFDYIDDMGSYTLATKFKDSCEAKSFFKRFATNGINNFVNVNKNYEYQNP